MLILVLQIQMYPCVRNLFFNDNDLIQQTGPASKSEPVSYTHLDVYKRQVLVIFPEIAFQKKTQKKGFFL